MSKLPWFPLNANHALKEPTLKRISRAARSLAWDMIFLMHADGEPYGHLRIKGVVCDAAYLAEQFGDTRENVEAWLAEIDRARVFDRAADGAFVSRRLVRDAAARDQHKKNGKRGGNPALVADHINGETQSLALAISETVQKKRDLAASRARAYRTRKRSSVTPVTPKRHAPSRSVTLETRDASRDAHHAPSRPTVRDAVREKCGQSTTVTLGGAGVIPPADTAVTGVKARERIRDRESTERDGPSEQARPPSPLTGGGRALEGRGNGKVKLTDAEREAKRAARAKALEAAQQAKHEKTAPDPVGELRANVEARAAAALKSEVIA